MAVVTKADIQTLLYSFSKSTYHAKEPDSIFAEALVGTIELMKIDYNVLLLNNTNGELSSYYPSQLIILETERIDHQTVVGAASGSNSESFQTAASSTYEYLHEPQKLRELINKARFARCRARFPNPVILYNGKYVCRSATLSGGPEMYGRSGLDYFFYGGDYDNIESNPEYQSDWQLFDQVRNQDIKLLKAFNVGTIIDFMVEKKKSNLELILLRRPSHCACYAYAFHSVYGPASFYLKNVVALPTLLLLIYWRCRSAVVTLGYHSSSLGLRRPLMRDNYVQSIIIDVTSSEKVDKYNRYSDFTIIPLPYPGCEFFKEYRDNDYSAKGLIFDWSQGHIDASVCVPDDSFTSQLNISWDRYKEWDLVIMTQNYMRLMLKYIQDSAMGILIHCISGWDRTPLFVSLLRLSLWADGLIHQQLDAPQILYLSIAYDWMLYGHHLSNRLDKGEDIFFFCFYMLKYIGAEDFSITGLTNKPTSNKLSDHSVNKSVARTDSTSTIDSISANSNRFDGNSSQGSSCTLLDEDDSLLNTAIEGLPLRKERLLKVRTLFYSCYCSTVGIKFKDGTDLSLSSMLGNIAEKVGLSPRTPV